jgi:hypothetical protein
VVAIATKAKEEIYYIEEETALLRGLFLNPFYPMHRRLSHTQGDTMIITTITGYKKEKHSKQPKPKTPSIGALPSLNHSAIVIAVLNRPDVIKLRQPTIRQTSTGMPTLTTNVISHAE